MSDEIIVICPRPRYSRHRIVEARGVSKRSIRQTRASRPRRDNELDPDAGRPSTMRARNTARGVVMPLSPQGERIFDGPRTPEQGDFIGWPGRRLEIQGCLSGKNI